jgi:hypothetical protein
MPGEQDIVPALVSSFQSAWAGDRLQGVYFRPWFWPDMALSFCRRPQDVASRLYCLSFGANLSITVVRSETSRVIVQDLGFTKDALPTELQPYLGEFSLSDQRAAAFTGKLTGLGAWTRADCKTNSRDGFECIHVMASTSGEHCFRMSNPDCHEDAGYAQIVNLYSEKFVGGKILCDHAATRLRMAQLDAAIARARDKQP